MDPHKVKLQIFFFLNLFFVFDVGSGTGKNIWIRDKHPGSATLVSCCENEKKLPAGNGETATRNCFKTKRVRSGQQIRHENQNPVIFLNWKAYFQDAWPLPELVRVGLLVFGPAQGRTRLTIILLLFHKAKQNTVTLRYRLIVNRYSLTFNLISVLLTQPKGFRIR